jgi:hypothetical protein
MKKEYKELLLKDLSARFPYGVIVQISLFRNDGRKRDIDLDPRVSENIWELIDKYHALPYLRPMSSMTEEEKEEYHKLCDNYYNIYFNSVESIDWLLKNHFDYRGLIEKGLAIEVTKENNPYKE